MKVECKKLLLLGLFLSGFSHFCFSNALPSENEYEKLMDKIRADFVVNPDIVEIENALRLYDRSKGCFEDIDYRREDRTHWPPITHLKRLVAFAYAYTNPENSKFEDETLYHCIVDGLNYWYEVNPRCNNWWYNQIAEPQALGFLMVQMRLGKKKIPADVEEKTIGRMVTDGGNPAKWTGANRTDIALHWLYRACLMEDEATLKTALENAFSPIYYTDKEGFQYDNSYMQHGRQLYIGGYGDEILKGVTQFAGYTAGTKFEMPKDKLNILSRFMRETFYQTIRGRYMLFDVLGRGISRPGVLDKSSTAKFAAKMAMLDEENADEFKLIADRVKGKVSPSEGIKPLHTHYFGSDYTLHVRPEYTFDVRMVSTRTLRCEYGNRENLKTYFLSDGCTNIVRQGDEYYNIFPVWNWSLIPGVTAPQTDTIPMTKIDWKTPGTSHYAGGVSDSIYGVSAYSYYDTYSQINTGANKSWFFFDDEVVCLGNVSSQSDDEVKTSINQCMLHAADILLNDGKRTAALGTGKSSHVNPKWVFHNGVGYVFPQGGNVFVYNQKQSGTWYEINRSKEKGLKEHNIFTIGLDYGIKPRHKSYAYVVVPTVDSSDELQRYYTRQPVRIVKNTEDVQSVYHKELGIWQIVFFKPGTLKCDGMRLSVDKECIVMVKNKKELYISDPMQRQTMVKIKLKVSSKEHEIAADFTGSGHFAGMTRKFNLKM